MILISQYLKLLWRGLPHLLCHSALIGSQTSHPVNRAMFFVFFPQIVLYIPRCQTYMLKYWFPSRELTSQTDFLCTPSLQWLIYWRRKWVKAQIYCNDVLCFVKIETTYWSSDLNLWILIYIYDLLVACSVLSVIWLLIL